MDMDRNEKIGLTIAVVEDNLGDFILIEDHLIEMFRTITINHFENYKSVSDYLKDADSKCDLILLDLNLPDMEGIELIENMVIQSTTIPIIILTGYADLPLAKQSLELGVYDLLIKDDITPILLHKSVEFALSRSSFVRQIENQNNKLRNIAWKQSHELRAPLARLLGIITMIEGLDGDTKELLFWTEQLRTSSNELDEIVRSIVNETKTIDFNK